MAQHRPRLNDQEYELWKKVKESGIDFIDEQMTSLEAEAKKAGIKMEDIKSLWWKGEHYSIFAKNRVKTYEEVKDQIIEELDQHSPDYKTFERNHSEDSHLLVIDPSDIHVGKLAVAAETGEDYNIEKAIDRTLTGVESLLNHSSGYEIDQILFVVGNDALHIDNPFRTTTSGTPQDTDGMWHTAFHAAKDMYVQCLEKLMPIADVHVMYCPSNHDYTQGFFLADTLKSWFRKTENVTFDASIAHRKYYKYHSNMIEADHGDGCKIDDTPMLMATEEAQMWANCPYRYSYKHHIHHKKKIPVAGYDDIGVNIEFLRSPTPPDSWHHRNGYVSLPAIEGFVHSKDRGRVAQFTHHYGPQKSSS